MVFCTTCGNDMLFKRLVKHAADKYGGNFGLLVGGQKLTHPNNDDWEKRLHILEAE